MSEPTRQLPRGAVLAITVLDPRQLSFTAGGDTVCPDGIADNSYQVSFTQSLVRVYMNTVRRRHSA
jgi:hypothetical protein